jgi:hypothetical protein
MEKHLPSKHKAQSSNPQYLKRVRERERELEREIIMTMEKLNI